MTTNMSSLDLVTLNKVGVHLGPLNEIDHEILSKSLDYELNSSLNVQSL